MLFKPKGQLGLRVRLRNLGRRKASWVTRGGLKYIQRRGLNIVVNEVDGLGDPKITIVEDLGTNDCVDHSLKVP